jgi:hypothetical protein
MTAQLIEVWSRAVDNKSLIGISMTVLVTVSALCRNFKTEAR